MAVIVGVARETAAGERRVALSPETCKKLVAAGATRLGLSGTRAVLDGLADPDAAQSDGGDGY